MVQTTIFLPPDSAWPIRRSCFAASPLMVATTPVVRWKSKMASCNCCIEHRAVTHHQHRIKQLLVVGIVQVCQEVRRPGNGIGFAGTGGMLDQVFAARPFRQYRRQQFASGVELVVTGEDDGR
jgi:hypothetical protein